MSPSLDELKATLSGLPPAERAELAHHLLRSLEPDEPDAPADARAAWLAVAEQRMADVRAGRVVGIPAEEVLKNLVGPGR
jgi:putative addiction module component (TIGR02574 family)